MLLIALDLPALGRCKPIFGSEDSSSGQVVSDRSERLAVQRSLDNLLDYPNPVTVALKTCQLTVTSLEQPTHQRNGGSR